MGILMTKTWFVYARDKNDKWFDEPLHSTIVKEDDELHHVGMFKHRLFQFALGKNDTHCSKIYLYHGWRRMKVHKENERLTISFSDSQAKNAWDTCKTSRLGNEFHKKWSLKCSGNLSYTYNKKTLCEIIQNN